MVDMPDDTANNIGIFNNDLRALVDVFIALASSEGSDEPAPPRSLVRTFAARTRKVNTQVKVQPLALLVK